MADKCCFPVMIGWVEGLDLLNDLSNCQMKGYVGVVYFVAQKAMKRWWYTSADMIASKTRNYFEWLTLKCKVATGE